MNEIVSYIIRLGYSPYLRTFEKKNAIMGAVEGGQIETVKLLLKFTFTPTHPIEFE
jgi:ankyrin repeat protein